MPYKITNACIACGDCTVVCPRQAIVEDGRTHSGGSNSLNGVVPEGDRAGSSGSPAAFYRITADCDACGCCREVCPAQAIIWQE
ncbi:4Fe-4S binding protein [Neomoorella mulderi]|uniref:NAD(P)H-quinone oxidoreductase subunit I, chloroplastic n=1 Tax=Moorella mulderi DSM 14980 TaxID=1122241 RepID=A0A151AV21_9FIRM|nr:4Fe-4S dicluster domain-containing protein [Moorella mulderi]KYH31451.1 NAD(P)H-quinone oxidoreductase subunit I, chloroplastic [Moorella mulderi DSM 14980]